MQFEKTKSMMEAVADYGAVSAAELLDICTCLMEEAFMESGATVMGDMETGDRRTMLLKTQWLSRQLLYIFEESGEELPLFSDTVRRSITKCSEDLEKATKELGTLEGELAKELKLRSELEESLSVLEEKKRVSDEAFGDCTRMQERLDELEAEDLEEWPMRRAKMKEELKKRRERFKEVDGEKEELRTELVSLEAELAGGEDEARKLRERREEVERKRDVLRKEQDEYEEDILEMERETSLMERRKRDYEKRLAAIDGDAERDEMAVLRRAWKSLAHSDIADFDELESWFTGTENRLEKLKESYREMLSTTLSKLSKG